MLCYVCMHATLYAAVSPRPHLRREHSPPPSSSTRRAGRDSPRQVDAQRPARLDACFTLFYSTQLYILYSHTLSTWIDTSHSKSCQPSSRFRPCALGGEGEEGREKKKKRWKAQDRIGFDRPGHAGRKMSILNT